MAPNRLHPLGQGQAAGAYRAFTLPLSAVGTGAAGARQEPLT